MKKEVELLLQKAERSIKASDVLYQRKDYDFAVARAYYAMFYAAEAALLSKNQTFSKHAAIISRFYHAFVATGEFPKKLHQSFHHAFEDRNQGDYAFLEPFPKSEADIILKDSKQFVLEIEKYLKENFSEQSQA